MLSLGCSTQVVYVYPDTGAPMGDASSTPDAGSLTDDAATLDDAAIVHADAYVAPGTCNPDRTPGAISQNDCLGNASAPICDAVLDRCVPTPHALCGACNSDARCQGVDLHAQCVFIPGDIQTNNDQACLVPCVADADCAWIAPAYGWGMNAHCRPLPSGSYCVGGTDVAPSCRNPDSTRAGDRPWGT